MEKRDVIEINVIELWAWIVSLVTVASMLFILCWIAVYGYYWAREPNKIILYAEILALLSGLIALVVLGWNARKSEVR